MPMIIPLYWVLPCWFEFDPLIKTYCYIRFYNVTVLFIIVNFELIADLLFQNHLYSSVYGELTCSVCNLWLTQGQIMLCACKIICVSCVSDMRNCVNCRYKFKRDIRLINFHQRIARKIDRPCKNRPDGCTYVVKPGDMHEITCQYEPVACDRCQAYVIKAKMLEHFEDTHFLGSKNADVKFADFYLDSSGSRKIKCVTNRGLIVYFSLFDINSVEFNNFAVLYPLTELNVSVKLEFTKQGYTYSRSDMKLPNNLEIDNNTMAFIDIDKNIFNDWVNGESKLEIEVSVRKKRQIQVRRKENVTKKAKTVKIGKLKKELKKEKQGVDKNIIRSLKVAHKQKMRNEYLKKPPKADPKKEC